MAEERLGCAGSQQPVRSDTQLHLLKAAGVIAGCCGAQYAAWFPVRCLLSMCCRPALNTLCAHYVTALPTHRGFQGGNVTFVYTITDGVTPVTATVTLIIPPPNGISPAVYNYTALFNTDFDGPRSVLDDVTSTNPGAQLQVVQLISRPNATAVGSVDVSPNGSFVFKPAPGWFGEWWGISGAAQLQRGAHDPGSWSSSRAAACTGWAAQ